MLVASAFLALQLSSQRSYAQVVTWYPGLDHAYPYSGGRPRVDPDAKTLLWLGGCPVSRADLEAIAPYRLVLGYGCGSPESLERFLHLNPNVEAFVVTVNLDRITTQADVVAFREALSAQATVLARARPGLRLVLSAESYDVSYVIDGVSHPPPLFSSPLDLAAALALPAVDTVVLRFEPIPSHSRFHIWQSRLVFTTTVAPITELVLEKGP